MNRKRLLVLLNKLYAVIFGAIGYLAPLAMGLAAIGAHAIHAAPGVLAYDALVTADQKFDMALEAQSEGDFLKMMTLLRQSGEAGNVKAQELLGMALLVGLTVYGQ